jgi:hypothetical protein
VAEHDDVADLADAVVDGEHVDWTAARARLSRGREHAVAHHLKTLSRLTTAGALPVVEPGSRRLSSLLETVRLIAMACCLVGAAGLVTLIVQSSTGAGIRVAVLLVFACAAGVLDYGGRDRRARALAATYWTIAAAFSTRGVAEVATLAPGSLWLQVFATLRPEAFFAACLWQFARDFPAVSRFTRLDHLCVAALWASVALGCVLFLAQLVPLFVGAEWLAEQISPGARSRFGPLFWTIEFGMVLPALATIWWRGRLASGSELVRVRLFLFAMAFSVAPVTIELVTENLVPPFFRIMNTAEGRFWGGWVVYPPMFAMPLVTAYAVAAGRVLNVRVAIRQGLQYLLARWLLVWVAVVPLALLAMHLYRSSDRPLGESIAHWPAPLLAWLSAGSVVLLTCRGVLLRLLDRWALPGTTDPSAMLASMTEQMKGARTPLEVTTVFAQAAERALQAPASTYLVRDQRLMPVGTATALPAGSLVPVLLAGSREPCVVTAGRRQSYYSLMTPGDQQWIDGEGVTVLVPVFSGRRGGTLLGVVALKSRRNALGFSQQDMRFLRAAAASASLACDLIQAEDPVPSAATASSLDEVALICTRCGRATQWTSRAKGVCECGGAQEPGALPKRLANRFEIVERLGAGGMGVVYRAIDLSLGRDVAIKTLPALSEDAASRLAAEARAMAGLSHSGIAVLYGIEAWRGTPLLVMEYLAGGTLAGRLRRGPLAPLDAIEIVAALASTLEHVHRAGQYHGDIKPSNIGFAQDGPPKLLDFGLTRAIAVLPGDQAEYIAPDRQPVSGTPAYLSPEVRRGAPAGPALDTWALALVLCECVLGEHPFLTARSDREMAADLVEARERMRSRALDVFGPFFASTLALDPGARPKDAAAFGAALAALRAPLS